MKTTKLAIALLCLGTLAACAAQKPKPTGAGSTTVLRLMRDWRGVWSGRVKESPMGPMSYTLYVEEAGSQLRLRMAPQRELELESMKHEYDLINFTQGTPVVRFSLTQRNATHQGELVYQEEASNENEAVFCPADKGCVQMQMSFVRLDDRTLLIRSMVDEAPHSEIELRYTSAKIPKAAALESDDQPELKSTKVEQTSGKSNGPEDKDLYLEEHLDQDIGEPNAD
jgi:hypothetical protein